ncbi:phage head morphogenesis protein [Acinetobacter brisouii]|uniref:phage head morphogenesis protein n=1 Tax=Acinetobacter brisouii TaxID=396323 RepID=UPI00124D12A4|nr:phage minor head protein [Acinetobacter brisouii]
MPTPQRPELKALFELPPQDAIDYLKNKGFKIGWDWHETLDDAHSRAFTVAKVARIDILQDLRKSLITALENGQSFEKWKDNITPVLQEKGWWGRKTVINPEGKEQEVQLGSPRRLRTIYDTNMQSAFSAGRYKAMLAGAETRPYWEWRHVTISNPRKQHLALNGQLFRFDDPFWSVAYPPSEWGCKCRVIARSNREVADKEILSSEGRRTEITEKVGTDRNTGADVFAKRTQFNIPTKSGETLNFAPAAGFNGSPASSYLIDTVLTKRATELMGTEKGLQQVQQMLNAQPRIKAHEAFVKNSMSFAKPQNKTSTVGVIQSKEIEFLAHKGQAVESPIMTISDHLMVGKKAQRHGDAGNAPTLEEWTALPKLIQQTQYVLWDKDNQSSLFILPSLNDKNPNEVIKLSVRNQNGVMEIVSIFKVAVDSVLGNLKSGLYENMRE